MLTAYSNGIFPWSEYRGVPLWYSPDPRMVLIPSELHVGRSLRKIIRRGDFEVRLDTAFEEVITACAETPRVHESGTWISSAYTESFCKMHAMGLAHSVESYQDGKLVGGLYGLSLGSAFFGESMFARASNASKVAFATLVEQLAAWDFTLIDCQVHTDHLSRFGSVEWPRARFLEALDDALDRPTRGGAWRLDPRE